jgi:hypothetical protein
MIEGMAELHMSEADVAKDFAAVLEKVVRQKLDGDHGCGLRPRRAGGHR